MVDRQIASSSSTNKMGSNMDVALLLLCDGIWREGLNTFG